MTSASPSAVLDFWFGPGMTNEQWFTVDAAFDATCCEVLGPLAARAANGELDAWVATPEGSLALVLLLDQAPRNVHRGTSGAWAQDPRARAVARQALHRGHDLATDPARRRFYYLPFEHSEELPDQFVAVALFNTYGDKDLTFYAERHREIVERFGRFPHRNAILGRVSTEAEQRFLEEPHSSF